MLEFILADQLVDLLPLIQASSAQEWQFQVSIVTGHIGRSTGRSTPQPYYRQLVAKNGNFRFLLLELTCNMDVRAHIGRSTGRSTPTPTTGI